jgi:hypothetical protein
VKEIVMASLFFNAILCASLAVALPVFAQEKKQAAPRRFSYGFRVEAFPLRLFQTSAATSSTVKPIADYTYTATSSSQKAAPGASVTYRLTDHISLAGEFFLHHAKYTQTGTERTGKRDPNASTDDRPATTIIQTTRANYWVVPVLARYERIPGLSGIPVPGHRLLSHGYVSGGFEFRHVGRIRTGNDITNPDGTTDYNETPATPSRTNQFGAVIGAGLRLRDELGIKVTPEVRFIRWQGSTFQGAGYRSTPYQAEAGLGFSF